MSIRSIIKQQKAIEENMTLFNWVTEILTKKRPWDSFSEADHKTFSKYMIHRFLSMNSDWLSLTNYVQKFTQLDDSEVYKIYCDMIPSGKKWLKYVKAAKQEKYADWLIELICKEFEVSKKHSVEYLDYFHSGIISKRELAMIVGKYGIEPKLIKKAGLL